MSKDTAENLGGFPNTDWSQVRRAGNLCHASGPAALSELLTLYRPSLRAHLVVTKRLPREQAEDLLHDFIANKVLTGGLLAQVQQQRGKFRNYLLTALDRYAISAHRRDNAQKRAPAEGFAEFADGAEFASLDRRPPSAADIEWARTIISEALSRVRNECEHTGRAAFWQVFDLRVVGPMLDGLAPPAYEELVTRLGFESPNQASNALLTTKRMFVRMLRAVVIGYARDEAAVEAEIQELRSILADSGAS